MYNLWMERPNRSLIRKVAICTGLGVHALALVWWNFAAFGMPRREAAVLPGVMEPLRDAGQRVETALGPLDGPLRAWVGLTASWQNWEMFAEPTRERSMVVLEGVNAFEEGRPVYDPRPVLHSEHETYEAFFLRNSSPPCGYRDRGNPPRDRAMLTRYVDYHLYRHEQETGRRYVGARYVCFLSPLPKPEPSDPGEPEATRIWVLWESHP
jgi:hypothetical protein